jgi:hypothetical protein
VDRLIIPFLLEWDHEKSKNVADMIKGWVKESAKQFPSSDHNKGRLDALAIFCPNSTPILLVFSYGFEPNLTT